MTPAVLFSVRPSPFERLIPAVERIQQSEDTPMLIAAVLACGLAAVLWRGAISAGSTVLAVLSPTFEVLHV